MRRVWVVEVGEYDDRDVAGVYASLKAAKLAHPLPMWCEWHQDQDRWDNRARGDERVRVTPFPVLGAK